MNHAGSNRHVPRTGGRQARSDEWKRARGERVAALREALGLTQDAVADHGEFDRPKMSKFESGANAATTVDAQTELADGFDLTADQIRRYLNEEIDLATVLKERAVRKTIADTERSSGTLRPERVVVPDNLLSGFPEIGQRRGYSDREVEVASNSVRGLEGTSSLSETQIVELLDQARMTIRNAARIVRDQVAPKIAPSIITDDNDFGRSSKRQSVESALAAGVEEPSVIPEVSSSSSPSATRATSPRKKAAAKSGAQTSRKH